MKIVQGAKVERRRGLEPRGGTFFSRTLIQGAPATPGNFKLSISEHGTDHNGPRHRHNFDQLRYEAFMKMSADEAYINEVTKVDSSRSSPLPGEEVSKLVAELAASTTPQVIADFTKLTAGTL